MRQYLEGNIRQVIPYTESFHITSTKQSLRPSNKTPTFLFMFYFSWDFEVPGVTKLLYS
jgi:hypothetical protein